jgi:hypothetical protein
MMILLFLLALIGLGLAAYAGRTADSRDPEYGLGLVLGHHPN